MDDASSSNTSSLTAASPLSTSDHSLNVSVPVIIGAAVGFVVLTGSALLCWLLHQRKRAHQMQHSHLERPERSLDEMLMEYASQGNLTQVLNKADEDQIDLNNLVLITAAMQVADALAHLDLHKVIHRDIAARNVLVFEFDSSDFKKVLVKVTDYGLALLTNHGFSSDNSVREVSTHSANLAGSSRSRRGRVPNAWFV